MAGTRDSVADIWGQRTPFRGERKWPARVDEQLAEKPDQWVRSCCVLCSNGCGLDIGVKDGRMVGVRGLKTDRVNRGRLGPKGLNGWQANSSADRLIRPLVRDGGQLREAGWDEAIKLIARRCQETMRDFTPDAVAFYNSGQLFLEEYYTLSMISHAGVGTTQLDGNTRLCTATASQALRETFGCDGQTGSFADLDTTDCLFLVGTNPAENQTVFWMRALDRRVGPRPPKIVVVDPRLTPTAKEADVHLAPRIGTNVALLNGILNLLIQYERIDRRFIEEHTQGFEKLAATVKNYSPREVKRITGAPEPKLREAAEIIGTAPTLVSAVLQGVYQSNQATAAACQVNNINLVLGKIGKPGCGVFQMNGQPTAQNTRETGCDGEFPFFMNWQNPGHVQRLADLWNVDVLKIPHWHVHAHAMEIFRHAELGSVKFLWVIGTNPAVSLPELHRIRKVLAKPGLFLVVSDAYLTETAKFADVVLPAALWGEKTGTFTNADRTVHISHKAIDPPGEARSDFDILLDFARRMDFRDRDGKPLIKWDKPEGAFKHWCKCSRGWFVDYSGLSYEKLSQGSGIPWPCNREHPDGQERIYTDLNFATASEVCQTYGHDIETGAARTPDEYRANDPKGRALLKAANYRPPMEEPDAEYPFFLTTGRVVYHFHTRTKTARCPALNEAAPEVFVQVARKDAKALGVKTGDVVEVAGRRGTVRGPARVGDIEPGHVFIPFHYGYWDAEDEEFHRAANELTLTGWDPVSKQPYYKYAAVQVRKAAGPVVQLGRRVAGAASKVADRAKEVADKVLSGAHPTRVRVPDAVGLLQASLTEFAGACRSVKGVHFEEAELVEGLEGLARLSEAASSGLGTAASRYDSHNGRENGDDTTGEPERLRRALFPAPRSGAYGALRDLQSLEILAEEIRMANTTVSQAAKGLRDLDLMAACGLVEEQNRRQRAWLHEQVLHRSVHTVTVPS
jgi:anaerobic selenocysteine-containing dehydrogenase